MNLYGLIGYPLTHSYSKKYFTEKFERESIENSRYELFEMASVEELPSVLKGQSGLRGLNVTIPHKQAVIPFLDKLDTRSAERIGAVNTIKVYPDGTTEGFNTDYYGFKESLVEWLDGHQMLPDTLQALVLGNGGASKAVIAALDDLGVGYSLVSRKGGEGVLTYEDLSEEVISTHLLVINTTPLGMYPNIDQSPDLPYEKLTGNHFLYDLVYNPEETLFLKKGLLKGAAVHNGLRMLILQAEKAWSIWNQEE